MTHGSASDIERAGAQVRLIPPRRPPVSESDIGMYVLIYSAWRTQQSRATNRAAQHVIAGAISLDDAVVDTDRQGRRSMGRPAVGVVRPRHGSPRRLQRPPFPGRLQVLGRRVQHGSSSVAVRRLDAAHVCPRRRQQGSGGGHLRAARRVHR